MKKYPKSYFREQKQKRLLKKQAEVAEHQKKIARLKAERVRKNQPSDPIKKYRDGLMAKRCAAATTEATRILEPFKTEERRRILAALSILCL